MNPVPRSAVAYMDPGNLASDINQGAMVGYSIIWVTIWSTVLGYFMQMVAARLGVVTGNDLAHHVRQEYAHPRRALLWILVEIAIITTDMLEVIGGASAFSTLSNGKIPMWAGVVLTGACAFLCLGLESIGMRYLEILLMVLISIMSGTFFYMFGTTNVDYLATLKGMVIPLVKDGTIQYIVGAIGAVIMPHNLFLHSSLMITRWGAGSGQGDPPGEGLWNRRRRQARVSACRNSPTGRATPSGHGRACSYPLPHHHPAWPSLFPCFPHSPTPSNLVPRTEQSPSLTCRPTAPSGLSRSRLASPSSSPS